MLGFCFYVGVNDIDALFGIEVLVWAELTLRPRGFGFCGLFCVFDGLQDSLEEIMRPWSGPASIFF